jgi:PAS domain S-box-containing protein
VLFSFRDVTEERTTALELAKTKEFLESLIRASVDAIIAASASGQILLFNPGAERITGWTASEVIGKQSVGILYPEDGAREVMRMIRSPQYGGVGRLEAIRWEVLARDGKRVPVQLSAAMLQDGQGRPSGTVGVFTDLREKLRIEMRLSEAQQKLATSERQALIAELAGTAAHELNQPLTSVIAYSELLLRKTPETDPVHRAITVISSEAHRMADIVRKIGKITRYETKSYVGSQKILDLDRSTAEESDHAPASSRPPGPKAP